ncbi:uncharacterized protein PG986_012950 [Apiospora aurea]|uniref:Uncharacterized protein n=1 Tax=Apiospora aurea TaxID=335848 RepID=A0ABR1Q256_9PEZI
MDESTASDRDMLTNEMWFTGQEAERCHHTQAAELKEQLANLITANAHLAAANAQLVAANSQLTAENRGLKATVSGRNAADHELRAPGAARSAASAYLQDVDASTRTEDPPNEDVRPDGAKEEAVSGNLPGLSDSEWENNRVPTKPKSCLAVAGAAAQGQGGRGGRGDSRGGSRTLNQKQSEALMGVLAAEGSKTQAEAKMEPPVRHYKTAMTTPMKARCGNGDRAIVHNIKFRHRHEVFWVGITPNTQLTRQQFAAFSVAVRLTPATEISNMVGLS